LDVSWFDCILHGTIVKSLSKLGEILIIFET